MSIVCIGDSLTYGRVGYSYIKFLHQNDKIYNKGVNGDTIYHTFQSLKRIINKKKYRNASTCIIGIGTNDILMPYLKTQSLLWKIQMGARAKLMNCIEDDEEFRKIYIEYLDLLTISEKFVILIGLPQIQLKDYPNEKVNRRNKMIKALAVQYGCEYVNPCHAQNMVCTQVKVTSWKHKNIIRLFDSIFMTVLPLTKYIYEKLRGLKLTVDGVHYTKAVAILIACDIDHILNVYHNCEEYENE